MTDEYKCPKCGSENVQRYSVAYQTGASTIDVNTTGAGFGGGHFGVGSAHSKGTQHTHMAASTAPPSKKRLLIPALLFFFAGFLVVGCTCKGRIADILCGALLLQMFFSCIPDINGIKQHGLSFVLIGNVALFA